MTLFGRRQTPQEMMRKNKRAIERAMRDLDRERMRLEQQEKKLVVDIKNMAKQNQMQAVRIMAKDLVRTKNHIKKFIMMRANFQAVSLKIQTLNSTNDMARAMAGVSRAMARMNKQVDLPKMQNILMNFEKESEIMEAKGEMMDDAVDTLIGEEDDDQETEMVVNQLLDELGISLNEEIRNIPTVKTTQADATTYDQNLRKTAITEAQASSSQPPAQNVNQLNDMTDLDDIEARLGKLRGNDGVK